MGPSIMMMKMVVAFIPNLLTLCNLLSGCGAIMAALEGRFELTFWLVVAAAVFDFFDGFAARMLHVSSPIGKELDSLADMVSFGVVPATVAFKMLTLSGIGDGGFGGIAYLGFVIAAFSALRLAKFNVDERQTEEFRGLPTPACALFFVALPLLGWEWVFNSALLSGLVWIFSALLVCDMPMFSLKFKSFGLKKNGLRYVFIAFSVLLIIWLRMAAPAGIILCYIVISTGRALLIRKSA